MRHRFYVTGIAVAIAVAAAANAIGHGTPIHVEVADNRLVVSQGVPGGAGFAAMMYVEDDEDGEYWIKTTTPPLVVWNVPGFEIYGMDDNSNLSLEVLRRPVADSSPPEERNLWYWNDTTELVVPAPRDFQLLSTAGDRMLTATDVAAPLPLLISDPMTDQQRKHNHELLAYALDNATTTPSGAYGFFAQLTSTWYEPSDPFLVVINNNVDYEKMFAAALAINAAAVSTPISGDYDANGHVEPADYQYWRERFGNAVTAFDSPDGNGNGVVDAADYVIWRNNITAGGTTAAATAAVGQFVPEPGGFALAAVGAILLLSTSASPDLD
jgi:hypothetical protein